MSTRPLPPWPWPADDPRRFMRYVTALDLPTGLDADGRKLCAWCPNPLPRGRRRYCSAACDFEAGIRMQPLLALRHVGERDGWRCGKCGRKLWPKDHEYTVLRRVVPESWLGRSIRRYEADYRHLQRMHEALKTGLKAGMIRYELDHVVPVSEGGGCCGLDGFRLLCLRPCHAEETGKLRRRLNARKREAVQPVLFEASR